MSRPLIRKNEVGSFKKAVIYASITMPKCLIAWPASRKCLISMVHDRIGPTLLAKAESLMDTLIQPSKANGLDVLLTSRSLALKV